MIPLILNLKERTELTGFRRIFLIILLLVLCLGVLNRYQLLNGFSLLPGDRYDTVISTSILEHWFLFFTGQANWLEVNYFYPYTKTIAQTDAYFLISLAYFPFRFSGLDPFLSAEFAGWIIKSSGFIGTYLLCRKAFSLSFYWALFAAIIFTLSNGMTSHSSRIQLATVAFAPIMGLLFWSAIKAFLQGDSAKFKCMGLGAGIFFGAWCLTCFYMAWFFAFFFTIFIMVILIMVDRDSFSNIKHRLASNYGSVIFVAGAALISLVPFIYAFLPKSRESGVRVYGDVLAWTVPLEGVLQVGHENFLFGKLYNSVLSYISPSYIPHGEYYNTGFPILFFLLFLGGCMHALKRGRTTGADVIFPALVITTLFTWVLALNIFGYSAWYYVFHIFPGAKALRVVSAYQIFLALPVVIIGIKWLSMSRFGLKTIFILCLFLIGEEINKPSINLDRQTEMNRISLPYPPPKECRVFYVSGWNGQEQLGLTGELYAHNVSAMPISQLAKIPTINGFASFNPPDWNFSHPGKSDYDGRIFYYSKKHNIHDLCKLNLNTKMWEMIDQINIENAYLNVPFYKESSWAGRLWSVEGLSSFENWGTWSSDDLVTFEFNNALPKKFNVHLIAHAFGPNIGKEFEARVGDRSVRFTLAADADQRVLEFDNPTDSKILKITVPQAISPKELSLGQSSDDRRLGIGFIELRIDAKSDFGSGSKIINN